MKIVKRILYGLGAVILLLVIMVTARMKMDARDPYPEQTTAGVQVPKFNSVEFPFTHEFKADKSLPFMASAIIDIDNDGVEEVFLGGGSHQKDGLFAYKNGKFTDISKNLGPGKKDGDASLGSVALDVNKDGYTDLLVTRATGVYLYTNRAGKFTSRDLKIPLNDKTTPLSIAVADINRDGHFDMYVSGYIDNDKVEGQNIFNKKGYGGTSVMLLNNGDNTFRDITKESGLYYLHNTFQGVFLDLDGDGLEDLVVAHDTGQVRTWKNLGNSKFKNMPNPNSNQSSYPMGIAVGDYNNDGRVDLFFTNVGDTPPKFLVRGDLRDDQIFNTKWILFRNDGGFKFTDTAAQAKLANFEFSWGAIFEDFNLDGRQDLVVSENYIGFPPHKPSFLRLPGRFLLQKADNTFAAAETPAGVENPLFSITPITADFNKDGYPDFLHVNIGGPMKAFINRGGKANHIKVKLRDTVESIGAMVTVRTAGGKTYTAPFISGEGLCSDSSHTLIFGLGKESKVNSVTVRYLSGETAVINNPPGNSVVRPQ